MVLMCDFQGMIPPEMQKTRHVVVMSPRRRKGYQTCLVVPFSTVAPDPIEPFHVKIPSNRYSFFRPDTDVWAKTDMITHVSFTRLDRVKDGNEWCSPMLNEADVAAIQNAVWHALGRPTPLPPQEWKLKEAEEVVIDIKPE
jgi:uncharacterized protein YifN (PemK superfamily)